MNKKLGLILMFVAAYIVLLGGLFWNMSVPKLPDGTSNCNVYDWFWGVSAGIVIACGAGLALYRNPLCLVGCGVSVLGAAYSIVIFFVGSAEENYQSFWMIIGAILCLIAVVITIIFYFKEADHIKKHGKILM